MPGDRAARDLPILKFGRVGVQGVPATALSVQPLWGNKHLRAIIELHQSLWLAASRGHGAVLMRPRVPSALATVTTRAGVIAAPC